MPGRSPYDDLPDGVVVADAQGLVVSVNSAAERILGRRAQDQIGCPLTEVLPLKGLDGRLWWACITPYDGLVSVVGHPERNLVLPDGTEVLVTARFVREQSRGPVVRVVVALRDTRHRAQEELSRAELVSTVAHELRSPLTSVKGFTATLLAKWDRFTDEQKRLMLETVDADADRVTRLITELLDIARIDSGRLAVRRQAIDLERVVRRHVDAMAVGGHDPGTFVVIVADGVPELWADADKLDQVVSNLLENAVRHGAGTVTVSVAPVEGGAEVIVSDEGEGISDEQRDRVFTKFWRSGRRGGTGLGLYIVRGLVEAHGGHIEVGKAESGGARFRFELPAAMPDFGDAAR